MDTPLSTLCAKCFNSLKKEFITCHLCRAKYHWMCANIDIKLYESFVNNKNMVFNCNGCLKITSNLLDHISSLSNEVRELKQLLQTSFSKELCEMKQQFAEFTKRNQKVKLPKKQHKTKSNAAGNCVVVEPSTSSHALTGSSNTLNKQPELSAASSVCSFSTVASNANEIEAYMTDDNMQPMQKQFDWIDVQRRRRKKGPVVVGVNESEDLDVVIQKKWVHLSSFKATVTSDEIIQYVEKSTEIGKQHMECYKLVKKDVDVRELKRVNFKLGISPSFYNELLKPENWPSGIRVRPFVNFPKKQAPKDRV